MIQKLRISNFALIEDLDLHLNEGFTVLTGETGSGKSILLNAFTLLLGERAHLSLVGPYGKKAIVEAQLTASSDDQLFFQQHNLDYDQIILLRREIVRDGKSRTFINDSPVSVAVLKAYSAQKLMVHSQYNTFELKSKAKQLELYDLLSGNEYNVEAFSKRYDDYNAYSEKLEILKTKYKKQNQDRDYNLFLKEELEELKLNDIDYDQLEGELFKLDNAEEIQSILAEVSEFTADGGVYSKVKSFVYRLERLGAKDQSLKDLLERLHSLEDDLGQVTSEASYYIDSIEIDSDRKDVVTKQWDEFNRLLLKHNLSNQDELVAFFEGLSKSAHHLEELHQKIQEMEAKHKAMKAALIESAENLHLERLNKRKKITESLQADLYQLKLAETKLDFQIDKTTLKRTGISNLSMLFSANKGFDMIEIENAASGGELSRLMLALLKQISALKKMPSILFDEIDAGVSGDVADKIGLLLHKMGLESQLLVISHLPQVASKASAHLIVEKKQGVERTNTFVRHLSQKDRIHEIARLMSGENITNAALETAKSLMK
jgi:DNA repair protein RecN (Recombination protein N)